METKQSENLEDATNAVSPENVTRVNKKKKVAIVNKRTTDRMRKGQMEDINHMISTVTGQTSVSRTLPRN